MNIHKFDTGDIIVRLQPAKYNGDLSYIGVPMKLVAVANGNIYLDYTDDLSRASRVVLTEANFGDDWGNFQRIVNGMTLHEELIDAIASDEDEFPDGMTLEEQLADALATEDYESAAVIRDALKVKTANSNSIKA